MESLQESLAADGEAFGIKGTLVEAGAYATTFTSEASLKRASSHEAYDALRAWVLGGLAGESRGDPSPSSTPPTHLCASSLAAGPCPS